MCNKNALSLQKWKVKICSWKKSGLESNQFCEKQVYPPKRFFPARGLITDRSAKTKQRVKEVLASKTFSLSSWVHYWLVSEKKAWCSARSYRILSLRKAGLSSKTFLSCPQDPLALSQKNKFTLQNVCSLLLGSLLTGQRGESMVLCPTI